MNIMWRSSISNGSPVHTECYLCIFSPYSAVPIALREVDGTMHAMVYLPPRTTKNTSKSTSTNASNNVAMDIASDTLPSPNIIYFNSHCDLHILPTTYDDRSTTQ